MWTAEFWVAVAFVIFLGVLIYFGAHQMILDALDQRSARIRAELDEARRLKDEAQALLDQYRRKQSEAEREAADILAGARAEAERLAAEAKAKSEEFLARRTKLAETKIAQAEAQALADVRNAAAEAAVAAAEKVLAATVKGKVADDLIAQRRRRSEKQAQLSVSPGIGTSQSSRRGHNSFFFNGLESARIARILCRSLCIERCVGRRSSWRHIAVPYSCHANRRAGDHGERESAAAVTGASLIIFDCNGVLVDSEPIAAAVAAQEFVRAGIPVTPEIIARYFFGRRPADMFAAVEAATHRKLPEDFAETLSAAILARFRAELRPTPHAAYALTWLRGPKCVASSSPIERIRASLETTDLARFFEPNLFSASDVPNGKPAPDLLLHAATQMKVASRRLHRGRGFAGRHHRRRQRRHDRDRLRRRQPFRRRSRRTTGCRRRAHHRCRHAPAQDHGDLAARVVTGLPLLRRRFLLRLRPLLVAQFVKADIDDIGLQLRQRRHREAQIFLDVGERSYWCSLSATDTTPEFGDDGLGLRRPRAPPRSGAARGPAAARRPGRRRRVPARRLACADWGRR